MNQKEYLQISSNPNVYLIKLPKKTSDVVVDVVVGNGYFSAPNSKRHLPHLLEHYIANILTKLKLDIFARINSEFHEYVLESNKINFTKKIPLFLKTIFDSDFSKTDVFELEKKILFNEVVPWQDSLEEKVFYLASKNILDNDNNYFCDLIDSSYIKTLQIDEIKSNYEKFFTTGNIQIFIGSYFDDKEFIDCLKKIINSIEIKKGTKIDFAEPKKYKKSEIVKENFYNSRLDLTMLWPGLNKKSVWNEKAAFALMEGLMANNHDSLLYTNLRTKEGEVYDFKVEPWFYRQFGAFSINLSCDIQSYDKIIQIIRDVISKIQNSDIKVGVFKKIKQQIIADEREQWSQNHGRFGWIKTDILADNYINFSDLKKIYDDLTIEDISKMAKKIFDPDFEKIIIVGKNIA